MSVDINNNISLNIQKDKGISHAIAEKLNFSANNVRLNKSIWNEIFEVVKSDNATETPQYKNGNINNVLEGAYHFTQAGWNKIVNIVENFTQKDLDGDSKIAGLEENPETIEAENKNEVQEELSNEQKVRQILTHANIEVNDEEFLDILNKYENIISFSEK